MCYLCKWSVDGVMPACFGYALYADSFFVLEIIEICFSFSGRSEEYSNEKIIEICFSFSSRSEEYSNEKNHHQSDPNEHTNPDPQGEKIEADNDTEDSTEKTEYLEMDDDTTTNELQEDKIDESIEHRTSLGSTLGSDDEEIHLGKKQTEEMHVDNEKEMPTGGLDENRFKNDKTEFAQSLKHLGIVSAHHDGYIRFWNSEVSIFY